MYFNNCVQGLHYQNIQTVKSCSVLNFSYNFRRIRKIAIVSFVTTVRTEESSLTGRSVRFMLGTFNEVCPEYLRFIISLQKYQAVYMKYTDS